MVAVGERRRSGLAACGGSRLRSPGAQDEPNVDKASKFESPASFEPITVPTGELFLLGDYRGVANDSSQNRTVPVENVIGIVML
ncbi:S26 family signal peptidase [Micromonospora purpureochromogenes]|uniref:S26 family signal peptidase n=1 Tax=Micromonospora purpureochromogenes TaxID=47872 RepID=UPI0033EF7988